MDKVGKFFVWVIVFILGVLVRGFVLSVMWNWFLVPIGLQNITLWLAIGISLTMSAFVGIKTEKDEKNSNDKKGFVNTMITFARSILQNLVFLGLGVIVHLLL